MRLLAVVFLGLGVASVVMGAAVLQRGGEQLQAAFLIGVGVMFGIGSGYFWFDDDDWRHR